MMKSGHAWSGAAAGLAVAAATGASPAGALLSAGLCAGAALLPDIDQPGSTIARAMGPLTGALSRGLNSLSARVYDRTATEYDDDRDGGHRGLTHTWPFALAVGALAAWATTTQTGLLAVLFFCLSLALRGLLGHWARRRGWLTTTAAAAALTAVAAATLPPGYAGAQLGALVALGSLVHCWGDSLTLSGCPWLWPIVVRGERWFPVRTPEAIRFRTNGTAERRVVHPLLIAGAGAFGWLALLA